jgi:glycosyltransferase involved in cell wall biosynthesis
MDNTKLKPLDNDNKFNLVYTGGIRRERGLQTVTEAIMDLDTINFHIAGPIIDTEVLQKIQKFPSVKYQGVLQPNEALSLEVRSDALVALYDPDILWNNITLPNKLFEAMMCGIPIITNVAQEIVNETGCGIIVEYDKIDQIRDAIITLRDNPVLCKKLGDNGRKAFLEKYNWNIMEERLLNIHESLISPD